MRKVKKTAEEQFTLEVVLNPKTIDNFIQMENIIGPARTEKLFSSMVGEKVSEYLDRDQRWKQQLDEFGAFQFNVLVNVRHA